MACDVERVEKTGLLQRLGHVSHRMSCACVSTLAASSASFCSAPHLHASHVQMVQVGISLQHPRFGPPRSGNSHVPHGIAPSINRELLRVGWLQQIDSGLLNHTGSRSCLNLCTTSGNFICFTLCRCIRTARTDNSLWRFPGTAAGRGLHTRPTWSMPTRPLS